MLLHGHGYTHGIRTIKKAAYQSVMFPPETRGTISRPQVLEQSRMSRIPSTWSMRFVKPITSLTSRSHSTSAPSLRLTGETNPISQKERKQSPWRDFKEREPAREAALLLDIASAKNISRTISNRPVELELVWLKDPLKLANRVGQLLKKRDVHLAVALIRQAQNNSMDCIVAWNNLFKYCFEREAPLAAFRFYNDMKKRGRRPNDQTYTIMLGGFSRRLRPSGYQPVQLAYSIYKSISASNSTSKRNIIHTNAMLMVCSVHGDTETMWKVVADLPDAGQNSADRRTYTMILKAISSSIQLDVDQIDASRIEDRAARRAAGVRDGKKIWSDIIFQWREGEFEIDNSLVNAMAGVLICGKTEKSYHDVFALYHQTMGIPVFTSSSQSSQQKISFTGYASHEHENASSSPVNFEQQWRPDCTGEDLKNFEGSENDNASGDSDGGFEDLFDSIVDGDNGSRPSLLTPGNAELSLILEGCLSVKQTSRASKEYWEHFTKHLGLVPDRHSFHQYLRCLRASRASRASVTLIQDQMIPIHATQGKTFHIAMSGCLRDRLNPNVFDNATMLLDLMDSQRPLPDPKTLSDYIQLINILSSQADYLFRLRHVQKLESKAASNGRSLQYQLNSLGETKLRPRIQQLVDAMEQIQSAKASASRSPDYSVKGSYALRAVVQYRTLIDNILMPLFETMLSTQERKLLQAQSRNLRKFSKPEMVVKFEHLTIYPTEEQLQNNITKAINSENDAQQYSP